MHPSVAGAPVTRLNECFPERCGRRDFTVGESCLDHIDTDCFTTLNKPFSRKSRGFFKLKIALDVHLDPVFLLLLGPRSASSLQFICRLRNAAFQLVSGFFRPIDYGKHFYLE